MVYGNYTENIRDLGDLMGFEVVNIKSKEGLETKWIILNESLEIGEFDFLVCDGYVEIVNKNSKGLVIADGIIFEKIENLIQGFLLPELK